MDDTQSIKEQSNRETTNTARWLGAIVVLQSLTLLGQWVGTPAGPTPVMAQIPDAGAQRLAMIDQIKGTNERLDKLITILTSGELQVKLAKPDENR